MRHIPALDGLRAIAVLAVVAYHAGLPVPAGFVGVDIFFVISGYLITRLLADEVHDTGRIDFLHFYARRARRILPAAILVVVTTLALSTMLPSGLAEVADSAAAASVFGANFYFQAMTGGYWSASAETMPLLHLWSLSVEEQFYLLWPLLLIAARRTPLRWLVTIAVASFVLAEAFMYANPQAAFYQMPARAWELALGGVVAIRSFAMPRWSAMAGLWLVLAACFVPLPHFPGIGALPAVAGSVLLIAAIHSGQPVRVLELRPVVYIGLISYSLYLWHWPLLAMDRALRVGESPLSVRLVLCGAAFVLAALSYRFVEKPFRRSRASPRQAVAAGLSCVVALSCAAFALSSTATPKPAAVPLASHLRCHPWGPGIEPKFQAGHCVPDAPKVVLWGDSYTGAWEAQALALAKRQDMAAVLLLETGCPAVVGVELPRPTARISQFCVRRSAESFAYLREHGADTLIVTSHWTKMLRERPDAVGGVVAWAKDLPNVRRILVVGATPEMRDSVERCQSLGVPCDIPRTEFDKSAEASRAMMAELARLPNVEILELGNWLCDSHTCPGVRDGVALYQYDNHHVSVAAVERFADLTASLRSPEPQGHQSTH